MIRKMCCLTVPVLILGLAGCGMPPDTSLPPEAVLAGEWVTMTDTGEDAVVTFDEMGVVTTVRVEQSDGATVERDVVGASTVLDDAAVVITIPTPAGDVVFDGTLSEDQNQLFGSLDVPVVIDEDGTLAIPAGNVALDRVGMDPCDDVVCEDGEICVSGSCVVDDPCADVACDVNEVCVDGECVAIDLCEGVECAADETCVDGECVVIDPCAGVECDADETCIEGECVALDPCEGVDCSEGESCVAGECVPDEIRGDAAAGEAFYAANNCGSCHGPNANDGFAPSLVGVAEDTLFDKLNGSVSHTGGTVEDLTEQDVADLLAWLESLDP